MNVLPLVRVPSVISMFSCIRWSFGSPAAAAGVNTTGDMNESGREDRRDRDEGPIKLELCLTR